MTHTLLVGAAVLVLVIPWSLVIAAVYLLKYGPNPPRDGKHRD